MPHDQITIAVAADLFALRLASAALRGVLEELGCEPAHAQSIELCVVEAMTNVVEHAYAGRGDGGIALRISADAGRLELVLEDHGRAMPEGALDRARAGLQAAAASLDEGGYGLGIIVELMETVHYERAETVNKLTMTTSLQGSST